jgi:hypothetical protein
MLDRLLLPDAECCGELLEVMWFIYRRRLKILGVAGMAKCDKCGMVHMPVVAQNDDARRRMQADITALHKELAHSEN